MSDELPYDQPIEIETSKAFAAFCCYRDLGVTRSIDRAYAAFCEQHRNGKKTAPDNTAAPRHWKEWARLNEWTRRAASYDAYLDEQNRAAAEADHLRELKNFRARCQEEARKKAAAASRLLERMEQRLADRLDQNPGTISSMARAAAALGEAALNAEAMSLGIEDLARRLED